MSPVTLTIVQANSSCVATAVRDAVVLRQHFDAAPFAVLTCRDADQAQRLASLLMSAHAAPTLPN